MHSNGICGSELKVYSFGWLVVVLLSLGFCSCISTEATFLKENIMDKSQGYSSEGYFATDGDSSTVHLSQEMRDEWKAKQEAQQTHECSDDCHHPFHGLAPKVVEVLIQAAKRKQNLAKRTQGTKRNKINKKKR